MNIRAIFFDIDDTLCRLGRLHPLSREVLRRLKTHTSLKLAIATGRSMVMLPADIRALIDDGVFDALVSANGQFNLLGGEVWSHYPLHQEDAAALAAVCEDFGLAYQQLSAHHIAWSQENEAFARMRAVFPECLLDPQHYRRHSIYQFSVFLPEAQEEAEIVAAFAALGFHFARWHKGGADILPRGGSKVRGIADICRAWKISVGEVMAFGDGLNDMEMLQTVGIGVAMADGWPQLQAAADYVCPAIEDDGIARALAHFGILPAWEDA